MTLRNEIDILKFTKELQETYFRYIYSTYQITGQEPELQEAFYKNITSPLSLINGPFIHCTPCYKSSFTLNELIAKKSDISLSAQLAQFPFQQFDPNRPLYTHQVEAIRILEHRENLVVATGTGSGKTECFLLPILNDILKNPKQGLRAIFIYPMNALADDQLRRLRNLLVNLPEITFGRYTGDTFEDENKGPKPEGAIPNERFFRCEIRESPPHILLTNFAMLEYLLLRPRDADIFTSNQLKFIVLDEAHTYSGAQGIEISLLMRRLKEYLLNEDQTLQFVLTSATLGDNEDAIKSIAEFASKISGSIFTQSNVLTGETVHGFNKELTSFPDNEILLNISKDEMDFESWTNIINSPNDLIDKFKSVEIDCSNIKQKTSSEILYELFSLSEPLSRIHQKCLKKPASFEELCDLLNIPNDRYGQRAVQWLITMGAFAKRTPESASLLPTRFHFFARGLKGATICLNPKCPGREEESNSTWSKFYLEDRNLCEHCKSKVLDLMTCVHCGLPVCRVFVVDVKWQSSKPLFTQYTPVLLTWRPELNDLSDELESQNDRKAWICLTCGVYSEDVELPECCINHYVVQLKILSDSDDEGNLSTCPSCGGKKGSYLSVLRDFVTDENAPTAVLTETLIRHLPFDDRNESLAEKPAHGRKLLVFSDARQRAAFFAPYLEQTTLESAYMNPLLKAIIDAEAKENRPVTIREVADEYILNLSKYSIAAVKNEQDGFEYYDLIPTRRIRSDEKAKIKKEVEIILYQDFFSSPRKRITLPGLGLACLSFDFNDDEKELFPTELPELFSLGEEVGWEAIFGLLRIFILRQSVYLPDHIKISDIIGKGPKASTFHLEKGGNIEGRQISRWNPYLAPAKSMSNAVSKSRQLDILAKLLKWDKKTNQKEFSNLLIRIWDLFKKTVLVETDSWPGEYRLDRSLIQITTKTEWGKCFNCGHLTPYTNLGFCLIPNCEGKIKRIKSDEYQRLSEKDHYRNRYFLSPLMISVKEHTAQLASDVGKKYQNDFMNGDINVLSSSTTFEMGVDIGDLKAVLLRNIPPTTSSYIQRTGRAGRRKDGVSVVLSYCRNTPHDQFHYQSPNEIISGQVPSPYLTLGNEPLTQRHCNSLLLGYFLRDLKDIDINLDKLTINDFFLTDFDGSTLVKRFELWLKSDKNRSDMKKSLFRIIPEECNLKPEIVLKQSIGELLTNEDSVFKRDVSQTLSHFEEQCADIRTQLNDSVKISNIQLTGKLNSSLGSLTRLIEQFKENRLIDFLSSCSWLPGYAFPQDVVKLLVRNIEYSKRMRLERAREIGISEYAPDAEVIADGRLFKSAGIWFNSKEPEFRQYARCQNCRSILTDHETARLSSVCGQCKTKLDNRPRLYIKPFAFQTLVNDTPTRPRRSRKPPARVSEVFLLEGANPDQFHEHKISGVLFAEKESGRLFLANSGFDFNGYYVCRKCGRGYSKRPKDREHETPWGTNCRGRLERIDLAHEFSTDILQLRFHDCNPKAPSITDRPFWLSFVVSFINGACDALDIDAGDLGGTYHGWTEQSSIGELVIYDRIPGGAGHIRRIIDNLEIVLKTSLVRVLDCKCPDLDASCYACLRNYSNQFYWESLQRRPVIDWLSKLLT